MAYQSPNNVPGYDPNAPRQYSSAEAELEEERNRRNKAAWDTGTDGGDEIQKNWDRNRDYQNPGSADYGGFRGGVDYYAEQARQGGAANDGAQAGNQAAMVGSYENAFGNRGPIHQENQALSNQAAGTRGQQLAALDLSRIAAEGGAPSEAAFQTRLGMNDVMATQAGQMGGARGLGALSGAQAQGGALAGASAGNLGMAGGLARSKEIADAIGMYGTQAGTVRDQDLSRLGMANQNSMFNAKANDDWKLGNAGLLAQQAQLGNAQSGTDLAWMGEQYRGMDKQFQYDQEMAAKEAGADADAAGAALARNREEKENKRQLINGGVTAGATAIGSLAGPIGAAGGAAVGNAFGQATKDWDW